MTTNIWTSSDNIKMHSQSWEVQDPTAIICLVHGMGEHIDRYQHFSEFYNSQNISVYGYDQRGHGKSEGKRGHSPSYQQLQNDLQQFLSKLNADHPKTPIILYGHSMGGNVVLNYILEHPKSQVACIATSPWIELAFKPPAFMIFLGKMVRNIFPGFTQGTNLDVKAISHDPNVVTKYETDPLVHAKISAAMGMDLMDAGNNLLNHNDKLLLPVLLMHGSKDELTSHAASQKFAENHSELIFKSWPGMFHEIHNEPEQKKVFDFTTDWIKNILIQL